MRLLVIGGTGVISSGVVGRAVEDGHDVTVVNRSRTDARPLPHGVERLTADVHDDAALEAALGGRDFDAVAQFIGFTPEHAEADAARWSGRTGQYLFISSATVYQKPPAALPMRESTPLRNPFWPYARQKIAAESVLLDAYRERDLPVTVIRPSHTYDETLVPTLFGDLDVLRMREGRPVVVHGDGTTLWTLTHTRDFAVGFTGLLGRPEAIGAAFTITGDDVTTWNTIYGDLARALGREADLVHVSSDRIIGRSPDLEGPLLGDRSNNALFDTSALRSVVPGFRTTVRYSDAARAQVARIAARGWTADRGAEDLIEQLLAGA